MNIKMDYIDENLRPNDFANGYSVRCVMGSPDTNAAKSNVASSKDSTKKADNIFIDPRDKQEYKFVEIGRLVWMAKNMNYKIGTSWCYDDKDFNCKKHGRLYDWNAANKACPSGWHLPSRVEWLDLIKFVDDEKIEKEKASFFSDLGKDLFGATGKIVGKMFDVISEAIVGGVSGKKLKSKEYKGTDNYGFSALLGGGRDYNDGFYYIDFGTAWWTATEANSKEAHDIFILKINDSVSEGVYSKSDGYSVRCVKDYK